MGLEVRKQQYFNQIVTDQEIETGNSPNSIPKGNSKFNYDREIYSSYLNYKKKYKKIGIQTGVRFEQFYVNGKFSNTQQIDLTPYKDKIFSTYPSAFLTYYESENNNFQFGYSKRVDRPSISQVTPILEWNSPLTISVGNRTLKPQFTDSYEVNYTRNFKKGYFTIGGFYRRTKDRIGRTLNIDPINENKQLFSYDNYDLSDNYGMEFSASYRLKNWWTITPSSNLYIQDSNGFINNKSEAINNMLFSARVGNQFKVSKKISFQLSASYRGKGENIQFKIAPYFLVNVSTRLSILKGKGTVSLRGTDIFDGFKQAFTSTNPFPQSGNFTLEYNSIYLGFSYNFGGGKNRNRERKYREENETSGSIL